MGLIFKHTFRERGMWRGWLKNGQSVELHFSRRGWGFGAGILVHSNDEDRGDRMLCLKFWRFSAYIPLGITRYAIDINNEPQWSMFGSSEFGLTIYWRYWRKSLDWPWSWHTLAYEQMLSDGSWRDVFSQGGEPFSEQYPYTYVLKSGEVQRRTATVTKRRHVICYRAFRALGWPSWVKECINVQFDAEVGERSGSWKGGCVGCSYEMLPGEDMQTTLLRMERERKF